MRNKQNIDYIYKQNLEESIIEYLSIEKNLELRQAMDIYYNSRLAKQIEQGTYGIENMDYKYLAQDLIENEPELLRILCKIALAYVMKNRITNKCGFFALSVIWCEVMNHVEYLKESGEMMFRSLFV